MFWGEKARRGKGCERRDRQGERKRGGGKGEKVQSLNLQPHTSLTAFKLVSAADSDPHVFSWT